jgi:hypothetical protein
MTPIAFLIVAAALVVTIIGLTWLLASRGF